MRITGDATLDPASLRGAIITNPNGAEFYCLGLTVDLAAHQIMAVLKRCQGPTGVVGVPWEDLADWQITLQPPQWME
jgi:hypothetical protein